MSALFLTLYFGLIASDCSGLPNRGEEYHIQFSRAGDDGVTVRLSDKIEFIISNEEKKSTFLERNNFKITVFQALFDQSDVNKFSYRIEMVGGKFTTPYTFSGICDTHAIDICATSISDRIKVKLSLDKN